VNDVVPPFYLPAAATKLFVTLKFSGGTVVLEHLANESVVTEAGTWTNDATYSSDQTRTQVAGTVGFMYRLRCTVAPTNPDKKGITAVLEASN